MPPIHIQSNQLLEKFLQYVQIGTAANPEATEYPSSPGQRTLGKLLESQLRALGVADAHQDENGLVWGTVPSTVAHDTPTVLLNAHLDTSPEAPGDHCKPQVIEKYQGGSIELLSGEMIELGSTPELASLHGHTLVTTDGRTLLGADDKAGVATIMQCVEHWMKQPSIAHGPIRILFTCDEEIGRGTQHFDLSKAAAQVGYTLDGGGAGTIDVETFSADGAKVLFRGRNTHPSVGKGTMINSLRAAAMFVDLLPQDHLSPESTCGREGVMQAGVEMTTLQVLLRDFETEKLADYRRLLETTASKVMKKLPGVEIDVSFAVQYRNMADALKRLPKSIELAEEAFRELGMECRRDSIRGGTDGALMCAIGLPTPNLSVGQYNIHSVREFASLNQMVQAGQHVIRLCELWAR
jgi:tripeptide aminopeptidase